MVATLNPAMSGPEVKCLASYLAPDSQYVEFGSGGSTLMAVRAGVAQITTVESSPEWGAEVRRHPEIAHAEASGRLRLHLVDIGPVMVPGFPKDRGSAPKWPAYYTSVWGLADPATVDVVLVDGRFRVACALATIRRVRPGTAILVHDFWDRPHYHHILNYADEVESVDRMVVLQPRSDLDWPSMCESALVYALDPR